MFDFHARVPKEELDCRLNALRAKLSQADPDWSLILIHHKVNLYYLTGAMQEGVLTITPEEAILWVRRSLERARNESHFADIRPMRSYRTLAEHFQSMPACVYLETKAATLDWLAMVRARLPFEQWKSITPLLGELRAVKSPYEIACIRKAGELVAEVTEQVMPSLLREGMSEAELCGAVYLELLRRGSMGISRYNQPAGEDVAGLSGFGESTLAGLAFDGPDGCAGTCVAVQAIGSPARRLKPGDLVLMDQPGGALGYHADKSVVYFYGKLDEHPAASRIREAYDLCTRIEAWAASQLRPGAIPEEIYLQAVAMVPEADQAGFMSGGKFLGHSIGLTMDEAPVLAKSFREPMQEGMVFAIEPKIALEGIGMVGTENTYLVTADGGESLTGHILPLTEIG
ncbi:MAG: Xaa-Pro peptidase family protein [Butyricicoccus sp.]|nr:Xaa-Pro peptidase family protein [Butyricicoccus sp.]